jgi:uncharacterized protein YutE (UPF0331/DUF86 family)
MEFSFFELEKDEDIQDLVDRRLQIAVEICIDIAVHLASGLNLPGQDTAKDVFMLLGKEGVIKKELAKKIGKACGFRNILVHQYLDIDYHEVFRVYQEDINDLRNFAKAVVNFLEKNPKV